MIRKGVHLLGFITLILCISSVQSSKNCKNQIDVVAVLDGSGSIPSADFTKLKNFVINLVNRINVGPRNQRFGSIVFSTRVSNRISLSSSAYTLRRQISKIRQPGGGTATDLGIQEMTSMFRRQGRPKARKVGIVITDGRSNSEASTLRATAMAKRAGVIMYAVGIGVDINKRELRAIASSSSYVMTLKDFNALRSRIKDLVKKICVVNGGWSSWSTYRRGKCSATCGRGTRTVTRTRTCTNPRPSSGGRKCYGSSTSTQRQYCNTNKCIVNGGWSSWSTRRSGKCSATCGRGTRTVTRTRTCTNPRPSSGGRKCYGSSTNTQRQYCNTHKCAVPVHGGWSRWSVIGETPCSATCGGGVRTITRIRRCSNPSPKNGGRNCAGLARERIVQNCNTRTCPVNGGWSQWCGTTKGRCSVTCGGGTRTVTRTRTCTNPHPGKGGKKCVGRNVDRRTERCNTRRCAVAGGWSSWRTIQTSKCSVTCGGGTRAIVKVRSCTNPRPPSWGRPCVGPVRKTYRMACNTQKCR